MAKRIIGALDIGSSKITAIIASIEDLQTPRVIGLASVPARGIKKGLVVNIDEAVNAIAQALSAAERMADVTIGSVHLSVSGKAILSKNNKGIISITHEEITQEDFFRAIEASKTITVPQGYEILHIMATECTVDAQSGIKYPIGMSGSRLEVNCHIILAPSSIVRNIAKCVQKLAIAVESTVFSGWASTYAVLTDTERELGVVLVDIGAGTTDIVLFQEGGVVYSGSIAVGGANITNDIAVGLHLSSLEEAEKIKLHYREIMEADTVGTAPAPKTEKGTKKEKDAEEKVTTSSSDEVELKFLGIQGLERVSKDTLEKIVRARIEEILELVREEISRVGYDIKVPAGMVLVGGVARLPKITGIVKDVLSIPARVGNPHGLEGMIDEISGPEFATAQGLILYAMLSPEEGASSSGGEGNMFSGLTKRFQDMFKSIFP
ncbi:MAG: cell division protein FtsA [Candidatus Dojkabacteria bacterium]|nr:MAG: cell division protein FtsA [Candidatus Dojkabacteria bacterium]